MADIIDPADILSGDKGSTRPTRRLAPGTVVAEEQPLHREINRNQLEIKAVMADGREHLLRCVEGDPDDLSMVRGGRYIVTAYTNPGELVGTMLKLKVYVRGRFHQEIEHQVQIGLTQGVRMTFDFGPSELGL
jgi:hypothetical protein